MCNFAPDETMILHMRTYNASIACTAAIVLTGRTGHNSRMLLAIPIVVPASGHPSVSSHTPCRGHHVFRQHTSSWSGNSSRLGTARTAAVARYAPGRCGTQIVPVCNYLLAYSTVQRRHLPLAAASRNLPRDRCSCLRGKRKSGGWGVVGSKEYARYFFFSFLLQATLCRNGSNTRGQVFVPRHVQTDACMSLGTWSRKSSIVHLDPAATCTSTACYTPLHQNAMV